MFTRCFTAACCALTLTSTAVAGVVTASWIQPGGGAWHQPSNWSSGVVPNNGGGLVFDVSIGTARWPQASVAVGGVVAVQSVAIGQGSAVGLGQPGTLAAQTIVNDGLITLEGEYITPATLRFDAPISSLSGSGIVLGDGGANVIRGLDAGVTLVHGPDHTIRGRLALGADLLRLENHGLIQSPSSGTLTIDLADEGERSVNSGVIEAIASGTLLLKDTTLENWQGQLRAAPGGTLRIRDSHVIGGSLIDADGDGPGSLRIIGASTLESVSVEGPLMLESYGVTIFQDVQHTEGIHLATETQAGYATLRLDDHLTVIDAGRTWSGSNSLGNAIEGVVGPKNTLEIETGATIRGGMQLGNGTLRLVNHGLIEADQPVGLRVRPFPASIHVNRGVMRAASGSLLQFIGGGYDNAGGVIEAAPGGTVRFGPAGSAAAHIVEVNGGLIRAVDGDTPGLVEVVEVLHLKNGTEVEGTIWVGPDSVSGGYTRLLWIGEGAKMPPKILIGGISPSNPGGYLYSELPEMHIEQCTITGSIGSQSENYIGGSIYLSVRCIIHDSAKLIGKFRMNFTNGVENHGTIECPPYVPFVLYNNNTEFINHPTGSLRLLGPHYTPVLSFTWRGMVENRGLFQVDAQRRYTLANGDLTQALGRTILHGELILPSVQSARVTGGELTGSGKITGKLEVVGGCVAPAAADGAVATFTVTSTYSQSSGGTLEIDLGAAADASVTASDRLAVSAAATLGGTLRLRLVDGFVPTIGERFTVLTAGSMVGAFDQIDSCVPVVVTYTPTEVIVTITAISAADINGDGGVDGADLAMLLGAWGACVDECCAADLNNDLVVDGADLALLLGAW